MKRVMAIIIVLFLFCIVYEFGVLLFIKKYDYSYTFTKDNKKYKIEEIYNYSNKEHLYTIKVNVDKDTFIYLVNHNFRKEKEIIEDLLVYKENNLNCIFPIFKDNVLSNIQCSDNNHKLYSYDYLLQQNDERVLKIKNEIEKNGYSIHSWKETNNETKDLNAIGTTLSYYTDFIPNYNVVVWNYKGVFSINKKETKVNQFLNFDVYDSKYLTLTNSNMYIMNAEEIEPSFDKIYIVNLNDGKQKSIDVLDSSVSTNSYFNGVYQDDIYFIDSNSNTQYKINSKEQKLKVTSKQNKVKYYDGKKLIDKEVSSISNSNIIFYSNAVNEKITKEYNTTDIRKSNNHYYFKTNNGNIYMCLNKKYNNPILLFNNLDFKEWSVVDDTIFGIVGNTLYAYNPKYGLKPIIIYNEFYYHTKNMYGAIRK
ncbi:MAG: hypothetical protein IKO49_04515 [Bacilli bacterium]|nr:hypothetical protein [Bacilli bacterium]